MPDWRRRIRPHLSKLNLAAAREEEIVEELAEHAEDRYRELLSGGAAEVDARETALAEVCDREALAAELRGVERMPSPEPAHAHGWGVARDVRYAVRSLRNSLAWALVVTLVLGIGIGANVAMFTLVDAVFLRPLRLPEPERLVAVEASSPKGGSLPVAYPDFVDWQQQSRSFESMGILGVFPETLKQPGGNEPLRVAYISPGLHQTLGIPTAVGRALSAADDKPGAPPVLVLSHAFYQSHFAGDPAVVGRTLTIDDQVWTIAGVLAPYESQRRADVFAPMTFAQNKWGLGLREQRSGTEVTARLKPGVTLEQARTEMKLIAARLAQEYPKSNGGISAVVVPLREYIGGGMRQPVLLLFGAVALLLLVACANAAGLLLARAAVRQRELAIRSALGASRWQLLRQLLTETLLLALGGSAAGVGFAWFSLAGLQRIFPAARGLGGIGIDARVLGFAIIAAAMVTLLCGLAPAVQLTRQGNLDALKSGGRSSRGGAVRLRTRKLLVVSQVALAVVLSIGAGLLMRSLLSALQVDPGFRPEHVVVASLQPPAGKDVDLSATAQLLREACERLAAAPGVQAAAAVDALPFSNPDSSGEFYRADRPVPVPGQVPSALKSVATPGYFRALGIPLLRGRLFAASDGRMPPTQRDMASLLAYIRSVELVAVINESMARRFWPGEDPIGRAFRFGPPSLQGPRVTIVGIVGDTRQYGLDRPVEPQYFFSADQFPIFEARLVVRSTEDAATLARLIRGTVAECHADAVVTRVERMDALIDRSLNGRQNSFLLLGAFSGAALLLSALGLYATMAYMVAQRTQEIGLRMALGADGANVRLMMLGEGALLAGCGLLLGLVGAGVGARVVASMLYGIATTDVLTYTGATLLLAVVMLAASYVPAWRASRVDPMVALRTE